MDTNRFASRIMSAFRWVTTSDLRALFLLFVVALLLRVPFITHPPVTEFDEVVYVDYSIAMLSGTPFIDIHPPLARMLFSEAARGSVPQTTPMLLLTVSRQFEGFPFERVRMLMILIGSLLPLAVYLTGRALLYTPRMALLIGLFVAFDNALIIYSRVILPDMMLLVFHFLALGLTFLSIGTTHTTRRRIFMLLAALSIGCALSIKWTALGMFGLVLLIFIVWRRFSAAIVVATIALLVYVGIFMLSLMIYFPHGGISQNNFPTPQGIIWNTHIAFPDTKNFGAVLRFIPAYTRAMYQMNYDPLVLSQGSVAQAPSSWPLGDNYIVFWSSPDRSATIHVTGNRALWVFTFLAFLFNLVWISCRAIKKLPLNITKTEVLLITGYAANYLPFFLLARPMYIYHYFTALIMLVILLPIILPRINATLVSVTKDSMFSSALLFLGALIIFADALFLLPTTYGF